MPYVGSYIWKIRQKVGYDPLLLPTADTLAVDGKGRLLLIHNKDFDDWFFPGGYAEIGQTFNECAARELLEEGGLVTEPEDLMPFAFVSARKVEYAK